jgi:pilus assembly protein Flp/PilA
MRLLRKFWLDQRGATAIEYGLIAALIAVAIIGAMTTMFNHVWGTFNNISNAV